LAASEEAIGYLVAHYTACFNGPTGRVIEETDIIVPSDDLALIAVASMLGAYDVDLWEYERLVATLKAARSGLPNSR
jgi:hypothetical protein